MRYADPAMCPDCRGVLADQTRCPHCGLDLTTPAVRNVWQALQSVDAWVAEARRTGGGSTAGTPPPVAATTKPAGSGLTMEAALLGLGAVLVLAAGVVFAALAWGDLSVAARALVLLAATAVAGAAAALVTVRGLRASAEALWAVFLGLFTLDWFAAREEGLLDLDRIDGQIWALVWAVLSFGIATGIVVFGRRHLAERELVSASIAAGLTGLAGGAAVAALVEDRSDLPFAWQAGAGLAAAWAFAAAQLIPQLRIGRWVALGSAGVFFLLFSGGAIFQAIDNPALEDLVSGGGVPLFAAAVASLAAGVRVAPLRAGFAVIAGLELLLLVLLPVEHEWQGVGGYVVASVVLVLIATVHRMDGWFLAARIGALVVGGGLIVATAPWYFDAAETLLTAMFDGEAMSSIGTDRWGIPLLVGGALAAAILLAQRWVGQGNPGQAALPLAGAVAVLHIVVAAAVATDVRIIEVYSAPLAVAALAAGFYLLQSRDDLGTWPALGAGVALALVPSLPQAMSDTLSIRALLLGLIAIGFVAVGAQRRWQAPFVGGSVALALVAFSQVWPETSAVPPWVLLASGGVLLLVVGTTWERRVQDGRAAARYVTSMR